MLSTVRKTLSIQRSGFGVTKRGRGDTEKMHFSTDNETFILCQALNASIQCNFMSFWQELGRKTKLFIHFPLSSMLKWFG